MPNIYKKATLFVLLFLQLSGITYAQQISGNVFIDRDGLTDNNINTSASNINNPTTNVGNALFANLLNSVDQVVASASITALGNFLFSNIPSGIYTVQLTTNASAGTYAIPATVPVTALPSGWINTGEFVGNTIGNDGNVNGKSANITIALTSIINEVNFGIEQLPVTADVFAYVGSGGAAGVFMPNQFFSLHNATFNGSDNEDQPNTGPLAGKTVKIITASYNVPGTSETGSLYYDGNLISANQIIVSYNPLLLKFRLAANTNDPWYLSGYELKFYYSYVDAAGIADPTPATYIVRYPVAAAPLPINLSDFVVENNDCNANLYWKTSSEINADRFEVEYNMNTNASFKTVGSVSAYGNSSSTRNYQFSFEMEAGAVYYLRLKMINKDGTFSYSEIRKLSCINASNDIKIAPNPALLVFHINGMLKGKNNITIFNNNGKLVSSFSGTNNKDIDISHLRAGVYVVRILNENGNSSVERLIKY
jgi:hypothetical protein